MASVLRQNGKAMAAATMETTTARAIGMAATAVVRKRTINFARLVCVWTPIK